MYKKNKKSVESSNAFYSVADKKSNKISELKEDFLEYARYELNFSPQTIIKYRDSLNSLIRDLEDKPIEHLDVMDFVRIKKLMMERGLSEARIQSIIYATKSFLNYCRDFLKIKTIKPKQIRPPKRSRREVIFLNKEEIETFVSVIDSKKWYGLRFRTMVEVLLGTGMRIGEVLSLNRKDIDWDNREAKIIGKGNKERTVFFTTRSLNWLRRYLESRMDTHDAIFITNGSAKRLSRNDISRSFLRYRKLSKIDKKITPHILRHTVATNLVFNGCPIVHVKEILGHEKLDTTCRYYLGVDKDKARRAHREYLNFTS
ncbi:tyrosine-type recombinase/integrase [Patescibacteria group bacterium]